MSEEKNCLDENRIIYFNGDFTEEKSKDIITKLIELDTKDPSKDILMIIDSYGGYVHSFLAIHDVMKCFIRCDVATLAIGKTMSCGQMLLMSGTKGKRFVTPNTSVLVHELSSANWGPLREMENSLNESKRLMGVLNSLFIKYTDLNKTSLKDLMTKDSYMTANEAVEFSIADHVVHKHSDIWKKIK
tara:strand:- start:23231 stop:23791 length:561 start_codon:yes stop_codon:yes gene_type:complete